MARITTEGVSNFDESKELTLIASQGRDVHWPPKHRVSGVVAPETIRAMAAEPVSVADQRAAGIPADETVTIKEQKAGAAAPDTSGEGGDESSAGTSSSQSGKKQGKNGGSARGTGSSSRSPAQTTGSPSKADQQQEDQAQSSTAPSASGSTPTTGRSR